MSEQITKIRISGRPDINIPPGVEHTRVLNAMGITNIDNYQQEISNGVLSLTMASGSKGLDFQIVDGVVLPKGGDRFPTDADIVELHKAFPNHDLFHTLEDPAKLQEYVTYFQSEERVESVVAESEAEATENKETALSEFDAVVAKVRPIAMAVPAQYEPIVKTIIDEITKDVQSRVEAIEAIYIAHVEQENASEEPEVNPHQELLNNIYNA